VAKLSKRMKAIAAKIDRDKSYSVDDAVKLLNEVATTKFKESIDVAINLGVDPRKSDQAVRGATTLPHGTGKVTRVAVFAQGANVDKAKAAGADLVGFEDLAEQIKGGELNFDVVIATPDAMRIVGQLGKVLGPRGLMPNPKTGTVTPDVETAVRNAKSGQVQFRADKAGIVHGSVGKVGFGPKEIRENLEALLTDLRKAKPASAKGVYLKKITLSTTMGPGVAIDQASLEG
jgi:large subunit ribosomal protein L1